MAARIAAGEDLQTDAHLKDCARCQALLAELEAIAQAARLLLPIEEEPDDNLWQKIEQAITSERP
jgi:anti-sigma factor RsiW